MKKIIATIAAAAIAMMGVSAFAQISVGAGYLNSPEKLKVNSNTSTVNLNGFYVGGAYNIEIYNGIGMAPGLYFSYLGKKDSNEFLKGDLNETYLTVPVMFNYGLELAPAAKLSFYAGPSFALGLSSKEKIEAAGISKTIDVYDTDDNYQRFDVLLGVGAALDIQDTFRISVGYDWGAIDRNGDSAGTLHRNQLHAGVAYLF